MAPSDNESLIDLFVRALTPAVESVDSYIWWTGAALTSSLMNRLCWTNVRSESLSDRIFGNLFILLIGDPGSGKTTPIAEARKIAMGLNLRIGPDDITGERLIHWCKTLKWDEDEGDGEKGKFGNKKKRTREDLDEREGMPRGTISLFLDEFEHLFHQGNSEALKRVMTAFYDSRQETYVRETYQRGTQKIDEMCMSLIGAATPAHMGRLFTRDEWQEGLPSRFVYIWGQDPELKVDFSRDERLMKDLHQTARLVHEFAISHNQIGWAADAKAARAVWRLKNAKMALPHPLLLGYSNRRYLSACKLAFVIACSRRCPIITLEDWKLAVSKLVLTEKDISKALAHAGGNEYRAIVMWAVEWVRDEKKVAEHLLRRKLGQQLPPQHISVVIEEMVASQMIRTVGGSAPTRTFGSVAEGK